MKTLFLIDSARGLGRNIARTIAKLDAPPVRLLVSASSYELSKAAARACLEVDERWKELSMQACVLASTARD